MAKGMAARKSFLPQRGVTRPRQSRDLSLTGLNASPAGPSSDMGVGTPRTPKRTFEEVVGESETSGADSMPMYRGRSNGDASPVQNSITKKRAKKVKRGNNSKERRVESAPTDAGDERDSTATLINDQTAHNRTGYGAPDIIFPGNNGQVRIPGEWWQSEAEFLAHVQLAYKLIDDLDDMQREKNAKRATTEGGQLNAGSAPIEMSTIVEARPNAEAGTAHQTPSNDQGFQPMGNTGPQHQRAAQSDTNGDTIMVSTDPSSHGASLSLDTASSGTVVKREEGTHNNGNMISTHVRALPDRTVPSGASGYSVNCGQPRERHGPSAPTVNSSGNPAASRIAPQSGIAFNRVAYRVGRTFDVPTTSHSRGTPRTTRFSGTGPAGSSSAAQIDLTQDENEAIVRDRLSNSYSREMKIAADWLKYSGPRSINGQTVAATPSGRVTANGVLPNLIERPSRHVDTPMVGFFPKNAQSYSQTPGLNAGGPALSQSMNISAVSQIRGTGEPVKVESAKNPRLTYVFPHGPEALGFTIDYKDPLHPNGVEFWRDEHGRRLTGPRAGTFIVNHDDHSITMQVKSCPVVGVLVPAEEVGTAEIMEIIRQNAGLVANSHLPRDGYAALVGAQRGAIHNRNSFGSDPVMMAPISRHGPAAYPQESRAYHGPHSRHIIVADAGPPVPVLSSPPPGHRATNMKQNRPANLIHASASLQGYKKLMVEIANRGWREGDLERARNAISVLKNLGVQFVRTATPTTANLATQFGQALQIHNRSVRTRPTRSKSI